ncbi:hypothetical protein AMS68_006735 [Peltaster fructicola]|uniref:SH3 domain-containing protein n=1 Tax=Peltaster fructicola TaxID=286661 RepID=A0A6H0Y2Z0_9PEZI|nr:hypothetical protein AMS68_006735 [Peltaster fructicola]
MAAVPFKVKAVYDYASQEPDDLSFPLGQVITVTEEIDADWYEGEYTDVTGVKKAGIFPNNFVEKYEPEIPSRPTRPTRPAKEAQPPVAVPPPIEQPPANTGARLDEEEEEEQEEDEVPAPRVPSQSKPAAAQPTQPREVAAPPRPDPTPAATTDSKKPPPVAPKSNAFKDRIAAFNAPAAAPILPFAPGRAQPSNFIKKPFVAPPPSKDAYIPQPKHDVVQKPYVREEDPEIRQRQEEDLAAAQSAGLTNEATAEDAEDAPKPQSLKDRIALLQKQQMEQAQRRADGGQKKEKKASADDEVDEEEQAHSEAPGRPSAEIRERPQIPMASRPTQEFLAAPSPGIPQHEILSGGEEADQSAAGELTEDDAGTIGPDESDERPLPAVPAASHQRREMDPAEDEDTVEEDTPAEADDDMDEDTRRRLELRERMAKMSGGMGMAGMFGPPGGMPMPGMSAPKRGTSRDKRSTESSITSSSPPMPQSRIPMIPVPGIQRVMSPEIDELQSSVDTSARASLDGPVGRRSMTETRGAPPPVPSDRPVPPPPTDRPAPRQVPTSRPSVPGTPPVPAARPLTPGSESDDEAAMPQASAVGTPGQETPMPFKNGAAPRSEQDIRTSYFGSETIPSSTGRAQQGSASVTSPRPRPPPPPANVFNEDNDRGESEYEGDYDTDIASSAKHKDALKSHTRDLSYDDSTAAEDTPLSSPVASSRAPPPVSGPASRAAPPPPPPVVQQSRPSRQSTDLPRAPPPVPPTRTATLDQDDDDEYDPYRYSQGHGVPLLSQHNDLYAAPPPTRKSMDRPPPPPPAHAAPQDRVPPPPPARDLPIQPRVAPRQSLDVQQNPTLGRRSMEQGRPSGEHGQIANEIELTTTTPWWTAAEPLPPALQQRNGVDLIFESEESSTSKRGGKTTISKDIYVLYLDYSQTVITARYDSRDPSDVSLEQRHESVPAKLRQDQLEAYWTQFGRQIAETANNLGNSKKEATIGDGSPAALVYELVKAQPQALMPVGTRAYGALVYANLANASVMQFDEIRPGDIITLRNAKFEGKHSGPMHQKYKQELGPSHVAIVYEWDGTKKKIRVWEQGREKKTGLKSESYRLADLKSGEVRIWRVVGREWVGWDSTYSRPQPSLAQHRDGHTLGESVAAQSCTDIKQLLNSC